MRTLHVDLDSRIRNSPRFKAGSLREYWRTSPLGWWKPEGPVYKDQERVIRRWLRGSRFESALEVGAGFGRITRIFHKLSAKTVLAEINEGACRVLAARFKAATIVNADFSNFCFWENLFDLAVAVGILVHIPDIPTFIKKVAVYLKPGGTFIVSITPLKWYEEHHVTRTVIHRGIDEREFEYCILRYFDVEASHLSKNGQLMTYLLKKK